MKMKSKVIVSMLITICLMVSLISADTIKDAKDMKIADNRTIKSEELAKLNEFIPRGQVNKEIDNVIVEYFNNEYEYLKTGIENNYTAITFDSDLLEYLNLRDKVRKEWNDKIGHEVNSYKIYIDFRDVNIVEDKAIVKLVKGWDLVLDSNYDRVAQARGEEHIVVMKKNNNKWHIEKDIYEADGTPSEADINNVDYTKNKANVIKDFKNNMNEKVKEFKELVSNSKKAEEERATTLATMGLTSYSYNYEAAVNYAHTYSSSYNTPTYPIFENDCTNYVSQCIYAGAPKINISRGWHCSLTDPQINTYYYGAAWTTVSGLYNF
jgi:hypothetical protein